MFASADVGGTHTTCALATGAGHMLAKRSILTQAHEGDAQLILKRMHSQEPERYFRHIRSASLNQESRPPHFSTGGRRGCSWALHPELRGCGATSVEPNPSPGSLGTFIGS
jgi:hypothetical protein